MPKAKAAFIAGERRVELREIEVPEPGPGEALVRVRRCGICGSDLHTFLGRWGSSDRAAGHEPAGEVLQVGPGVTELNPGDRVAVEPMLFCGECGECRQGNTNRCLTGGFVGGSIHGAFAELLTVSVRSLHRLPPNVTLEQGALMEPLSVSGRGVRRIEVAAGDSVLVVGAGTIGLAAVAVAKAEGAEPILCAAKYEHQAEMARRLGATHIVPVEPDEMVKATNEIFPGGVEVGIETVGALADTLAPTAQATTRGGRLLILGAFPRPIEVALAPIVFRELHALGSNCYGSTRGESDYRQSIRLTAEGRVDLAPLVTHRFPLDQTQQALETALDKTSGALKVMIEP